MNCCAELGAAIAQSLGRAKGIHQQMFIEEPSQQLRLLTVVPLSRRKGHRNDPEFAVCRYCPFCGKQLLLKALTELERNPEGAGDE